MTAYRGGFVVCSMILPRMLFAQAPEITAVVNTASYISASTRSGALAPGSIATIYGKNLASVTMTATSFPLPKRMGNTVVNMFEFPIPLLYVSPTQINVQVPAALIQYIGGLGEGGGDLVVSNTGGGGGWSNRFPVYTSRHGFGIFTAGDSGCGQGAIQNITADHIVLNNSRQNSARPGDWITVYGTGIYLSYFASDGFAFQPPGGPSIPNPDPDPLFGLRTSFSAVEIDGRFLQPSYFWGTPGLAGVIQANIRLPEDLRESCNIPLRFVSNFSSSQYVSLAVARGGGACRDDVQIRKADLTWQRFQSTSAAPPQDSLSARFDEAENNVFPPATALAPGTCRCGGIPVAAPVPAPVCAEFPSKRLPRGDLSLSYERPGSSPVQLTWPGSAPSDLFVLPGGAIGSGAFSVARPAANGLPGLRTTLNVPAPIEVTTDLRPGTRINHCDPLRVEWKGGTADQIVGMKIRFREAEYTLLELQCSCATRATDGRITLPVPLPPESINVPNLRSGKDAEIEITTAPESVKPEPVAGLTGGLLHRYRYVNRYPGLEIVQGACTLPPN